MLPIHLIFWSTDYWENTQWWPQQCQDQGCLPEVPGADWDGAGVHDLKHLSPTVRQFWSDADSHLIHVLVADQSVVWWLVLSIPTGQACFCNKSQHNCMHIILKGSLSYQKWQVFLPYLSANNHSLTDHSILINWPLTLINWPIYTH